MKPHQDTHQGRRILLIIGGGIAAYKCLELIRLLAKRGVASRAILTRAGAEFVTPLSVSALTGEKVYSDLFDLTDEAEMGHIELSRAADLIVVCPATADLMAKAATGLANDLASTALLATDKPVLMVPAMNVRMWEHKATRRNVARLRSDGVTVLEPDEGEMACGEFGPGRLPEIDVIAAEVLAALERARTAPAIRLSAPRPLEGRHALVTAGPTREPIDPVRYLSNQSSGKQGFAIAGALAALGAKVTLVAGPVTLPTPRDVTRVDVQTAHQMLAACEAALPADVFVAVAAVADWRPAEAADLKLKKDGSGPAPLSLVENPDILRTLSAKGPHRPRLVIGFAAETNDIDANARKKLLSKGCDWIVANDVSGDVMGGEANEVAIFTREGVNRLSRAPKDDIARHLASAISEAVSALAPSAARDARQV
jgi:phosphopantothenoylcysteine decarboxylase/phosphopantothenate--cysteine ligase